MRSIFLRQTAFLLGLVCLLSFVSHARAGGDTSVSLADLPVSKPQWKADVSTSYETGRYGTSSRSTHETEVNSLTRSLGPWDLTLTIPFIHQRGEESTSTINGVRVVGRRGKRVVRRTMTNKTVSEAGIGDVTLEAAYNVLEENENTPLGLSLSAEEKFPTADASRGLGTGEYDETFGVALSKEITKDLSVFSNFSYTMVGQMSDVQLNNQFNGELGFDYWFTSFFDASLSYKESTSPQDGLNHPREFDLNLNFKITDTITLYLTTLKGLTSGSPDFGGTVGSRVKF